MPALTALARSIASSSSSSASSSSLSLSRILNRPTNPSILPIPPRTTGNNVPKSLHKTRRTWQPNTTRTDWAVSLPSAFTSNESTYGGGGKNVLKGVKMQIRRRKDVEKAGGIEGLLLSRPSKHLTPFGKQLRSALFEELHRVRSASLADREEMSQGLDDTPIISTTTSSTHSTRTPTATATEGGGEESILTGSGR